MSLMYWNSMHDNGILLYYSTMSTSISPVMGHTPWRPCTAPHSPPSPGQEALDRTHSTPRIRRIGGALSPSKIQDGVRSTAEWRKSRKKERDLRSTEEGEERARAPEALTSGWGLMNYISSTAERRKDFDPSIEFPRRDESIYHCFIAAK